MHIPSWLKLTIAITICEAMGIIGSVFTVSEIPTWYATLAKPVLNPPSWIFGPVWTLLYACMGISLFLVWRAYEKASTPKKQKVIIFAVGVFFLQLVLNTLWSVLFFGLHNPALAFVDLVAMWVAILATIILFAPISKAAAYLLVPYILWVTFAGYLNFSIWQLNKSNNQYTFGACTQEAKICQDGSSVSRTGPQCQFTACPGE